MAQSLCEYAGKECVLKVTYLNYTLSVTKQSGCYTIIGVKRSINVQ